MWWDFILVSSMRCKGTLLKSEGVVSVACHIIRSNGICYWITGGGRIYCGSCGYCNNLYWVSDAQSRVQVEQCGLAEETVWVHAKVDGDLMLMMRLRRHLFVWG